MYAMLLHLRTVSLDTIIHASREGSRTLSTTNPIWEGPSRNYCKARLNVSIPNLIIEYALLLDWILSTPRKQQLYPVAGEILTNLLEEN